MLQALCRVLHHLFKARDLPPRYAENGGVDRPASPDFSPGFGILGRSFKMRSQIGPKTEQDSLFTAAWTILRCNTLTEHVMSVCCGPPGEKSGLGSGRPGGAVRRRKHLVASDRIGPARSAGQDQSHCGCEDGEKQHVVTPMALF